MTVNRSTVLDAPPERVWEALRRPALLVFVPYPNLTFAPVDPPAFWKEWGHVSTAYACGCSMPSRLDGRSWELSCRQHRATFGKSTTTDAARSSGDGTTSSRSSRRDRGGRGTQTESRSRPGRSRHLCGRSSGCSTPTGSGGGSGRLSAASGTAARLRRCIRDMQAESTLDGVTLPVVAQRSTGVLRLRAKLLCDVPTPTNFHVRDGHDIDAQS